MTSPFAPLSTSTATGPAVNSATVELPTYAPGQLIDAPLGDIAPPTRGIRPRRRSRLQLVLIGLSGGTALLVLGGLLAVATALSPIGSQRASRAAAEQELRAELEEGERVVAQTYVSQRNWWDNFRESFGVLAATDRRLVFVALPPVSWVRGAADDGPPELRVQSFAFEAPFRAEDQRLMAWTSPGIVVETAAGKVRFLVPYSEVSAAGRLEQYVASAQVANSRAIQQEQIGARAPLPPAPVYVSHTVRGGESVTSIARRYRTSPDVIRQLNRLASDRIRIGQRLRVPQPQGLSPDSAPARPGLAPQPANIP